MSHNSPRSFNTVKNSHRDERTKRLNKQNQTLFSVFIVACLTVATALIFLITSFAVWIGAKLSSDPNPDPDLPSDSKQNEIVYTSATASNADIHKGDLIVVSEKLGLQYTFPSTSDFVLIEEIRVNQNGEHPYQTRYLREDEKLLSDAAYAVNQMLTDFYLKHGDNSLILMDTYRSQQDQATSSTTPVGFSEHHTGLVFTIRTYNKNNKAAPLSENPAADWIYENCYKYGIICRYPSDKTSITGISGYEYCFRYVGVAHATYMKQNNLCLEEYIELLRTSYSGGNVLNITDNNSAYQVYYVSASSDELTTVPVPKNYQYSISGDNKSGFVITVYCNQPIVE